MRREGREVGRGSGGRTGGSWYLNEMGSGMGMGAALTGRNGHTHLSHRDIELPRALLQPFRLLGTSANPHDSHANLRLRSMRVEPTQIGAAMPASTGLEWAGAPVSTTTLGGRSGRRTSAVPEGHVPHCLSAVPDPATAGPVAKSEKQHGWDGQIHCDLWVGAQHQHRSPS